MNKKYHHYSGKNSSKFWNRIDKFKGKEHDALYTLGIVLQKFEESVLDILKIWEKTVKEEKEFNNDKSSKHK